MMKIPNKPDLKITYLTLFRVLEENFLPGLMWKPATHTTIHIDT